VTEFIRFQADSASGRAAALLAWLARNDGVFRDPVDDQMWWFVSDGELRSAIRLRRLRDGCDFRFYVPRLGLLPDGFHVVLGGLPEWVPPMLEFMAFALAVGPWLITDDEGRALDPTVERLAEIVRDSVAR
jgi:hypothetical protein